MEALGAAAPLPLSQFSSLCFGFQSCISKTAVFVCFAFVCIRQLFPFFLSFCFECSFSCFNETLRLSPLLLLLQQIPSCHSSQFLLACFGQPALPVFLPLIDATNLSKSFAFFFIFCELGGFFCLNPPSVRLSTGPCLFLILQCSLPSSALAALASSASFSASLFRQAKLFLSF